MRVYVEVARYRFKQFATYRAGTAAGVFTNTAFAFLKVFILGALWKSRGTIGGYDLVDVVTFVFLSQALAAPLSMFSPGLELPDRIRTGDVATDLQRPADFQMWWLAGDLGRAGYQLFSRGLPPFLVAALVFGVRLPGGPAAWTVFAVSLALALVISFSLRYVAALIVFWLMDMRGVYGVSVLLMQMFSGMLVPLVLLPGWLGPAVRALPWAGVLQVPADIFLGKYTTAALAGGIAFQMLWAAALLWLGWLLTRRIRRVVVANGG